MNFQIMTMTDAKEIVNWKYPQEYSFYDFEDCPETFHELLDGTYYAVRDQENQLIGFFCFGRNAQVQEGHNQNLYSGDNVLDIGIGMKPELTGKGMGFSFLKAGIEFAKQHFKPDYFRLNVAAFNKRAIKVYSKMGFQKSALFVNRGTEFIVMTMGEEK